MRTLQQLVRQDRLEMEFQTSLETPPDGMAKSWVVTLRFPSRNREMTTLFHVGSPRDPELADVVECLVSDAQDADLSFEEYAEEYQRNADSRAEYAAWEATRAKTAEFKEFLGSVLFEQYLRAER